MYNEKIIDFIDTNLNDIIEISRELRGIIEEEIIEKENVISKNQYDEIIKTIFYYLKEIREKNNKIIRKVKNIIV